MTLTTTDGTLRRTAALVPTAACGVTCYGVPARAIESVRQPRSVLHLNLYRQYAEWVITVGVDMGKPNTLFVSVANPHREIMGVMW